MPGVLTGRGNAEKKENRRMAVLAHRRRSERTGLPGGKKDWHSDYAIRKMLLTDTMGEGGRDHF